MLPVAVKKGATLAAQYSPIGTRHFRPVSGVKAARKCAEGWALRPLTQAGTESSRGQKVVPLLTATDSLRRLNSYVQ